MLFLLALAGQERSNFVRGELRSMVRMEESFPERAPGRSPASESQTLEIEPILPGGE